MNLRKHFPHGTGFLNGITKNESEGVRWLKIAADKGNTDAMFNLGVYQYNKGEVLLGMDWLKKAADNGSEKAIQIMEEIGQ